jgi:murein DD-endopeptidase MepM/ murein hydrolase activator NlpD
MKIISILLFLFVLLPNDALARSNISKNEFHKIISEKDFTGFVLRYWKEKSSNEFEIILPKKSPPIISDYHSIYGVLGGSRTNPRKHGGIDFYVVEGDPLLAAADGIVYGLKVRDKCVGNQLAIDFGISTDGTRIYATHMHIGKIYVKVGEKVKRGQVIAEAGRQVMTRCGGGVEHLHFHISKSRGMPGSGYWGSWRFLGKPHNWLNPHNYWTGGAGKAECFNKDKKYVDGLLTLPVKCLN